MTAVWLQAQAILRPRPPGPDIKVPDGQTVLLKALARGIQNYGGKATEADPGTFDW